VAYGVPHDVLVAGFGTPTVSTLRLWKAEAPDAFDFDVFSKGDLLNDPQGVEVVVQRLKKELAQVRKHRTLYRRNRKRSGIPVVALVGYTNAGKSTLLNRLAKANIYVANQLFATLDPTTKRINPPEKGLFL
jgi:ribosome biogenesis GTPase A